MEIFYMLEREQTLNASVHLQKRVLPVGTRETTKKVLGRKILNTLIQQRLKSGQSVLGKGENDRFLSFQGPEAAQTQQVARRDRRLGRNLVSDNWLEKPGNRRHLMPCV